MKGLIKRLAFRYKVLPHADKEFKEILDFYRMLKKMQKRRPWFNVERVFKRTYPRIDIDKVKVLNSEIME